MPVEGRTVVLGFVAEVDPAGGVFETVAPGFVAVTVGLFDEPDDPEPTRLTAPEDVRVVDPIDGREDEDEPEDEPEG